MIKIDDKQIKKFERDLKAFTKNALKYATQNTVNSSAFKARKISQNKIKSEFINRNKWTINSIKVIKANQKAYVGSVQDYMKIQEFGGVRRPTGGEHVAIATGYSAGQKGLMPRTRLPTPANRIRKIKLQNTRIKAKSKKQLNFIKIKEAAAKKRKFVYLDLGRKKGIFKVIGNSKKPKINMVYDMSRKEVTIHKKPWLLPSVNETKKYIPKIYFKSLKYQIEKHGLFKNRL